MDNQIVKTKNNLELVISDNSWQEYLNKFLGDKTQGFINNMLCIYNNDIQLQKCDVNELINAGLQATTIGLPLSKSLGRAYVIAYQGHAQFQMGYKGLIEIAIRTGYYKHINVTPIYEESELRNNDFLIGKAYAKIQVEKTRKEKGLTTPIGYCAKIVENTGYDKEFYMSKSEVEAHGRKYSKAYNFIWTKEFDKMACKTVLKLLLNQYGRTDNSNIQKAIISDQAVIANFSEQTLNYIDNPQNEVIEVVVEYTQQQAIERLRALFGTNVFSEEEKQHIREMWKNNWKQAIADADEAYAIKSEA